MNKEPAQNLAEQLPQINVKPLNIVEPQMLGKTSLVSKTTSASQNQKDQIPNDFQPKQLKKNNSEKILLDPPSPIDKNRTSEGSKREENIKQKESHIPKIPDLPVKWKTIFKSQVFPVSLFEEELISVEAPWLLNQSTPPSPPPSKPDPLPETATKYDSNISTGHSNLESNNSSQNEGGSGFSQQSPKPEPVPVQPKPDPVPQQISPKQPVTIESIFKKYRQQNKTVTRIVHKKNQGKTEKWVYFADGSSVLEDPGDFSAPVETPKSTALPPTMNNFQTSGQNPNFQNQGPPQTNASGIQPSNVYFYDHSNLVAEFDPENPNNIAMTLYEITTLQQKHLYCKYFEPSPDPKFREMESIVDCSQPGNPSVYHQLDQLNDEDLLKPKVVEVQKPTGHYWTKSLRKSNKRIISKKNKPISKKTKVISNSSRPYSN